MHIEQFYWEDMGRLAHRCGSCPGVRSIGPLQFTQNFRYDGIQVQRFPLFPGGGKLLWR
jgi:hypothetical protein